MNTRIMVLSSIAIVSGTITVAMFAADRAWVPAAFTALAVAAGGFMLGVSWADRRADR